VPRARCRDAPVRRGASARPRDPRARPRDPRARPRDPRARPGLLTVLALETRHGVPGHVVRRDRVPAVAIGAPHTRAPRGSLQAALSRLGHVACPGACSGPQSRPGRSWPTFSLLRGTSWRPQARRPGAARAGSHRRAASAGRARPPSGPFSRPGHAGWRPPRASSRPRMRPCGPGCVLAAAATCCAPSVRPGVRRVASLVPARPRLPASTRAPRRRPRAPRRRPPAPRARPRARRAPPPRPR
jgi:hypothetical protein